MIPEGFKYVSAHFVHLASCFAIDGQLLGKRLQFRYSATWIITVTIPKLTVKGSTPSLSIPGLLDKYGVDLNEWGIVKGYQGLDRTDTVNVWIFSILVECYDTSSENRCSSDDIHQLMTQVIHALQVINPDSVRACSDSLIDTYCEVKDSVYLDSRGNHQESIMYLTMRFDDNRGKLSLKDIAIAVRNCNKSISVPYEMLDNARMNLSHKDSRSAILNCATAIEIVLKRRLTEYLNSSSAPSEVIEYILKLADGFVKEIELCKRFSIPLSDMSEIQEKVFSVRNRIIHGGFTPTKQNAENAYGLTRETLAILNVPMFE